VSWELTPDEKEMVLALPARERYGYCIQLAVDGDEAWGLKNEEGWVLAGDEERDAFPLWPHPDLAAACALGDWEGAVPEPIGLDELLEDLLPILVEDGIAVAVFPGVDGESAVVSPQDFRRDLEAEIELGHSEDPDHDDHDHEDHDHDHEKH
jgi:Protein of unknown function (DUF2750)